ncbi:hypothetical protein PPERSA_10776 [Pseudocohnilembus persalinus]|uniref:Uncharacterized protein n=1 Tax=Pseudocohnilembus persalinus TaxID=266149 RepID=A0A0V0QDQ6_PSEPJ|nr:hypothetical protein PPERSA_10776 [Pseudocohnilembus persalinus]|eukprot:KRX00277.1 hypothetical protein PPERSA_10776 [Pseudocohnilembus persalinus]
MQIAITTYSKQDWYEKAVFSKLFGKNEVELFKRTKTTSINIFVTIFNIIKGNSAQIFPNTSELAQFSVSLQSLQKMAPNIKSKLIQQKNHLQRPAQQQIKYI